ncbi:unnamed protein product [Rhizoctonia solani]|uniref:Uncharacterized protein n=1 Tax=Rhizoctonia solani TaxID=456999 RepID=A0A8H2X1A1_9AGAM|nr:unnamed protein product [Rhizoctonia solani]
MHFGSFKHAQSDSLRLVTVHATSGTEDDLIHSGASVLPRVLDRPKRPTRQNRLPELVERAVKNIESLDAKRACITAIDAKSLAGLDIASRKRKYGVAIDGRETSKPFYSPSEAVSHQSGSQGPLLTMYAVQEPRAFSTSPSPELPTIVDTCVEYVEDMLSFGTPSDRQSTSGTQITTIRLNGETWREQTASMGQTGNNSPVSSVPEEAQSSVREIDIPPTLYEDAFRVAARTLKLQDALLTHQANASLTSYSTRPSEDDSGIRAFNLFTPVQINVLDRNTTDPEPRTMIRFQDRQNPKTRLSDTLGQENGLDVGNQPRNSLTKDRQGPDQSWKKDSSSELLVSPHREPRLETPKGTNPPNPPQRRRTRKIRSHWNIHEKLAHRDPTAATKSAPKSDNPRVSLSFASAESTPSPSQVLGVSLTTGNSDRQTIGLQLFDGDPQVDVEMDA